MSTSPIRVLHVDDDPSLLEVTGEFLKREDDRLVLETATSANEGLDQLGDRPPDCIVSDYDMPGKTGIEFLQAVRETHPDLPFILFTGKGSESVASDAIAASVTDYLQKGSGTEQYKLLANRITNAVEARRESERANRQQQLMRLTEFAGDTGGFELDTETGDVLMTAGTRRILHLPEQANPDLEKNIEQYHPDDRDEIRRTIQRAVRTGEQTHGTFRYHHPDAEKQQLLHITYTPAAADGDTTTIRGAIHDITERYERRQDLKQIETLFQHAQDSLFLIDVDDEFTIQRVNPTYEKATGLAPDLTHGKTITELLPEQQASAVREKYQECIRRREPLEYEERLEFGEDPSYWETRIAPVVIDGDVEYIAGSTRNVTEKRERQRELRLLQQAVDGANAPLTLADPTQEDNPLVYVNNAYKELTGYSEKEALGRNCRYLQGEDTDSEKVSALREVIDDEESITVELRNYRKDGTEFWNRLTVTPIYDDDRHLVRYLGTQQDVTERRERERELRAEQEFTEQALDTLDDLFYVLNSDGTIRRHNEQFAAVTGYDPAKLDGLAVTELFPEDEQQTIADAIEATLQDDEVTIEADLLTAGGRRTPYEFTGARLTDTDGDVTGLVGVGRNLTERRQREQRFQQIIKTMPGGIVELDAEGEFVFANERAEEVLGLDSEGVTGRTYNDPEWDLQDPSGGPILDEGLPFSQIRDTGEAVYDEQLDIAWPDGTRKLLLVNGAPVFGEDGSFESAIFSLIDITDREERRRELARTKALMSKMEQLADIGAWEYDPETGGVVNTAGTKRIHEVDLSVELTLEEAFESFHPADRDRLRDRFDACLETGESYEIDVRLTTPGGRQRWITAHGERVTRDGDGSVVRGYMQDITEQKQLERDLRQERDLVEGIIETTPVGIAVVAADGDLSFVNGRAERIYGRSRDEIEEMSHDDPRWDLVNERGDPIEAGDAPFNRVVSQETPVRDQIVGIRRPSGERVWLSVSGAPQYGDDSELERAVFAFEDITEQRKLEAELSETLGRVSDAFYALDSGFQFTHVNGRAEELLGVSEDELLDETVWDMYPEAAETDKIWDTFHIAMETQDPQDLELYYEPLDLWLEASVYPSESGISVYFRDVTEQKEYERELEAQNERLEEFTSVVSHDLRNPLTVAGGRLELAQEACESPHLAQAADAINRSQELIEDLLTLAREGEDVAELEPVALADMTESCWQNIESQSATLETHTTQTIQADQNRLKQLFENLYRNAIEHGGDDVIVSVGSMASGFYVADTGPGITESDREKIFEAGYSTAEEGTGFGLRIVKQVVEAHGWDIRVTDSDDNGARFEITGVDTPDQEMPPDSD